MDFTDYLRGEGLAEKTISLYGRRLRQALSLAEALGVDLLCPTATELRELADLLPNTHSSRRQLRSALVWWWRMHGVEAPVRAIRVPRKPRPRPRALDPDDARLVAKAATGLHPEGTAVLFGLYLALRGSEIAGAEWSRLDDGWYTVLGKGDVTATLPVHPALAGQLATASHNGRWVFPRPGHPDEHISYATVWNWTQHVADLAGVGHVQTHQLRHTALTTAHDNLGDLRAVSEFARHARVETTMIYTRTTDRRLRSVSDALDY